MPERRPPPSPTAAAAWASTAGPRPISRRRDRLDHDETVISGFTAPGFAGPAVELAHIRARFVARERVELFGHGIEAHDRIGAEIGKPDLVLVVDINGVGAGIAARQLPGFPGTVG